jgi:hypothetical protein
MAALAKVTRQDALQTAHCKLQTNFITLSTNKKSKNGIQLIKGQKGYYFWRP